MEYYNLQYNQDENNFQWITEAMLNCGVSAEKATAALESVTQQGFAPLDAGEAIQQIDKKIQQENCRRMIDEIQKQPIQILSETPKPSIELKGIKIKLRFDTVEEWERSEVVLLKGELTVAHDPVYDTMRLKCGDGTRVWRDLPYISMSY